MARYCTHVYIVPIYIFHIGIWDNATIGLYHVYACKIYKMGGAPPNPTTLTFNVWGGAEHHLTASSFYTAPLPRQVRYHPPSPLLLYLFKTKAECRWVEAWLTDSRLEFGCLPKNQPRGLSTTNPGLAQLHCKGHGSTERGNRTPSKLVTAKLGQRETDASNTNSTIPIAPAL